MVVYTADEKILNFRGAAARGKMKEVPILQEFVSLLNHESVSVLCMYVHVHVHTYSTFRVHSIMYLGPSIGAENPLVPPTCTQDDGRWDEVNGCSVHFLFP